MSLSYQVPDLGALADSLKVNHYPAPSLDHNLQSAAFIADLINTATESGEYPALKARFPKGAPLSVESLFSGVRNNGALAFKPRSLTECLVFVTTSDQIHVAGQRYRMRKHTKSQVGLYSKGRVYSFNQVHQTVVCESRDQFVKRCSAAYGRTGASVNFYYGRL
jgi:hypothetical protein